MGSLTSSINDRIDEYDYLCYKFGEIKNMDKVFSQHHYWLEAKNNGSTISFDEWKNNDDLNKAKERIEELENKIVKHQSKIKKLKKKWNL